MDCSTELSGKGCVRDGDISICLNCGTPAFFIGQPPTGTRAITPEEMRAIKEHAPDTYDLLMRAIVLCRQKGDIR